MTIHDSILALYRTQAQRFGAGPCFHLADGKRAGAAAVEVSYATIFEMACRMEHHLEALELAPGSVVALLHHRAWQAFPLLAACAARGLTLAPLNPDLHPDELRDTLLHAGAALVIGDMGEDDLPRFGRASVATLEDFCRAAGSCSAEERPTEPHDHPALLIYTSGTTGGSKAVMLPERSLLFAAASTARFYGLTPEDRVYGVLPYHHMNAVMATGLIPMTAGAQICVGDSFGFTNAKFYWKEVERLGATIPSLTPSIMSMLLKLNPHGTQASLDDVRFAWCGAAPLPESLWREFEERFGVPVYQGYGLTETSFWTVCVPPDVPRHYDTVGIPVDCEIRIDTEVLGGRGGEPVEEAWEAPEQASPSGAEPPQLGEILIRSGGLMSGYYKNRKLTSAVMTSDGFLRTGDIGYLDAEGYLRIVGRKKEIIIRNGINILPDELDAVIQRHPDVKECKTIGLPDDYLGERIVTVCVLAEGSNAADLRGAIRGYAREHLSTFKRPDDVIVLSALPRGVTGKVSSATLRRIVSGEVTEEIVSALTKRKFRRADPGKPSELRELVDRAVRGGEPVRFVKYWGVGERDAMNEADELGLKTLQELMASVSVIPEVTATLTLILNNMHGRMNGRVPERAAAYLGAIAEAARAAGFNVEMEDEVWRAGGIELPALEAEAQTEERKRWFDQLPVREKMIEQAGKHSRLRGGEDGALLYATACQAANRWLEERYAGHIFLTYNPPDLDIVSPDLPRLYIFPHRRGNSDKPWFTP